MPVHACGSRCARGRRKGVCGCPRVERALPEGVPSPRARRTSFEGLVEPSSEADPARGSVYPSSEEDFTQGASAASSWRAAGATRIVVVLCMHVRCVS
jgi:hypothetical protein